MAESKTLTVAVGTTNPTKLEAARVALTRAFPNYEKIEVLGASVRNNHPFSPLIGPLHPMTDLVVPAFLHLGIIWRIGSAYDR